MESTIGWAEYSPIEAEIIERSDKEIALDYMDDGVRYTILLRSENGIFFQGEYELDLGDEIEQGIVQCKKFINSNGFLLHGILIEGGGKFHWWAEKSTVARNDRQPFR